MANPNHTLPRTEEEFRNMDTDGRGSPGKAASLKPMPKNLLPNGLTVAKYARSFGQDALEVIYGIMMNPEERGNNRLTAAGMLLDRGFGRPVSVIQDVDGEPTKINGAQVVISVINTEPDSEDYDNLGPVVDNAARQDQPQALAGPPTWDTDDDA